MAENLTIARPYAKAAFDFAVENKDIDNWQNMLYAMSLVMKDSSFVNQIKLAANTSIAANSFIELLKDLVNEYGINFIKVIAENNRFEVIPDIYAEFLRLRREAEKTVEAKLISARAFSNSEIKLLEEKLAKKYDAKVNLSLEIDQSLIGGAILKIGDQVFDASVRTSLDSLSSTLK